MASTYTTDLAIQLMATGENAGTWGQITNTNLVVIQQAIAGYESISIAGGAQTTALVMTQNALANARNAVIKLTGTITGNQVVTIPNGIEKTWIVSNGTTGAFTVQFKYASTGTGQTWSTTDKGIKILYADGSDIQVADLSTLSGSIVAAQITNSTITQAKLAANSVGTNQLQTDAVTAIKITQSTITQSKLAANSVGANQLISTGVTAATYTSATITVDADGRITSASSGSAGAGGFVVKSFVTGPASGTYTKSTNSNYVLTYMQAGGGGGGNTGSSSPGQPGGPGGFGYFAAPTSGPYSQPYSVGAGGPAQSTGGATNITNLGTVNGGGGGTQNTQGNQGTAPGQTVTFPQNAYQAGFGGAFGRGGGGAGASQGGQDNFVPNTGSVGQAGALIIFENTGT